MAGRKKKTTGRAMVNPSGQPMGYGLYNFIHKMRHPGVVRLSERGYAADPLRAYETALGLKPRPVVSNLRRRRNQILPGYYNQR